MSEKQFFNILLDYEKNNLISYIQKNNIECSFKIYDTYIRSQFLKTQKNEIQVFKKNTFKISSEKIIVTFESVGDQYFFESTAYSAEENTDSKLFIEVPAAIYKLQRRNDFRVSIPSHLKPLIKLKDYPELKAEIRDLSLGGCRIALKTDFKLDLQLDYETQIHIKILDFEEKNLHIHIKFIDHIVDAKTTVLGLQFSTLDSDQSATMRNTLLQIDRMLRHKTEN